MNLKGRHFLKLLDFTPEEIRLAIAAQYTPCSLGSSRLRTETAGLVAVHTLSLINL